MTRGKLIAIEGIDGAGKSTLAKQIVDALRRKGHDTILTREPWSPRWREAVCNGDAWASTADRAAHMHEVVWPALERGIHVVTDRFYLSCAAYETAMPADREVTLWTQCQLFGEPDLWVWLDAAPAVAIERICARDGEDADERLCDLKHLRERYEMLWPVTPGARLRVEMAEPMGAVLGAVLQTIEVEKNNTPLARPPH